jgi:hypothetical protein
MPEKRMLIERMRLRTGFQFWLSGVLERFRVKRSVKYHEVLG